MKRSTKIYITSGAVASLAGGLSIGLYLGLRKKEYKFVETYSPNLKDKNYKFKKLSSAYKDKEKKHYIYMMLDSLTSFRLAGTIEKLKRFASKSPMTNYNGKALSLEEQKVVREKLSLFNEFELKINVISPSYRTENGISGAVGGAYGAITTQEYERKGHRQTLVNHIYYNLFNAIGSSDNIDKIYVEGAEFFHAQHSQDTGNTSWKISDLPISEKAKKKIDKSIIQGNFNGNQKIINAIKHIDPNLNTLTLTVSDLIHDSKNFAYQIWPQWNTSGENLLNLFINMKQALVDKGIWDQTEIMIVSDHGNSLNKSGQYKDYPFYKGLVDKGPSLYKSKKSGIDWSGDINFSPTGETQSIFERVIATSLSGILYKPRYSKHKALDIDFKNLYMNADAMPQLYHDMGIDPYYLKFDYFQYMDRYRDKKNIDGSYNSFIDDPFHKDLTKRILITMDRHQPAWGIRGTANLGSRATIWNGPFWKNDNGITLDESSFKRIILDDNADTRKDTWLEKLRKVAEANKEDAESGFKVLGNLFDQFDRFISETNKKK